uniref:Uncharacterized protein n=1 Tax=Candidatus Kentrum sp. LPFa TaxID=2126335 RepID=A0A450XTH8_9GAMM|nr:MAG: hypothetical protein BECKLPF1236C_GA0070990_101713 [Candidatus Kentron sp. LPFa]
MALDPVPGINGMTYPCRDDGIAEFGYQFHFASAKSCFIGSRRSLARRCSKNSWLKGQARISDHIDL